MIVARILFSAFQQLERGEFNVSTKCGRPRMDVKVCNRKLEAYATWGMLPACRLSATINSQSIQNCWHNLTTQFQFSALEVG